MSVQNCTQPILKSVSTKGVGKQKMQSADWHLQMDRHTDNVKTITPYADVGCKK